MRGIVATLITLAALGCGWLTLDPNNKPDDCGRSWDGYVGYPDSIPVVRTMHCRETQPGVWIFWFEDVVVDTVVH